MDKKNVIKNCIHDGKGGFFGSLFGGNKVETPVVKPTIYNIRGVSATDDDLNEAANILYSEVSNRSPEKQAFEVNHIINTAVNRSLSPGLDKGKTLKEVLQRRAQYQGYAPEGTVGVKGQNQYQKASSGSLNEYEKIKMQTIKNALSKVKDPSFTDTTNGAQFYVHATDGTLWVGRTQQEALTNAKNHEIKNKLTKSKFGGAKGMPVQSPKG